MELGDGYTKLVYGVNRKDEKAWQELFDSYYESLMCWTWHVIMIL